MPAIEITDGILEKLRQLKDFEDLNDVKASVALARGIYNISMIETYHEDERITDYQFKFASMLCYELMLELEQNAAAAPHRLPAMETGA